MIINKVAVCGAGTMGSGIAQVCAAAGFTTILYEVNDLVIEKAKASIEQSLQIATEKGKLKAGEKEEIIKRILFTNDLQHCVADIVIEAIIEKPEIKIELFNELAGFNSNQTIFASNTSSLSISDIGRHTKNPERVAGLHFFNPAPLMKLVEVVKGNHTSEEVINTLVDFTKKTGKIPVVCQDAPGFIVNRVARPYYIESLRLLEEGIADHETIDRVLESRGFKMGPFKLMDLIGNDINYAVSCSVYDQLEKPERLKPSILQKEKLDHGALGRKTKRGYYDYN